MSHSTTLYTCLLLMFSLTTQAQSSKYSNEFLNIGVDAASMAMAGSVVAKTSDANAIYWNPAGITNLTQNQVSMMHASYFGNIAQYDFIAYAMPTDDKNYIGIAATRFGIDNILNTLDLIDEDGDVNYDRIQRFSTADYAFTLSYARKMPYQGLSIGANTKIIRRLIGNFAHSWGVGFDVGIQYTNPQGLQFGAMFKDITTTYNVWSVNEKLLDKLKKINDDKNQTIPQKTEITLPKLQIGIGKKYNIYDQVNIIPLVDINIEFQKTNALLSVANISLQPSFGFEADYKNIVFLRGGIGNIQQERDWENKTTITLQPNIGVGFIYKNIQLDYALTNIASTGGVKHSNIFSLKYSF